MDNQAVITEMSGFRDIEDLWPIKHNPQTGRDDEPHAPCLQCCGGDFGMLLDLARAASFLLSIVTLSWATLGAFFVPGSHWQDRLTLASLRLALAACVSLFSGLLFSWRTGARRPLHQPLTSTLPVQLFFWTVTGIVVLFLSSWYLASYPCSNNPNRDCSF